MNASINESNGEEVGNKSENLNPLNETLSKFHIWILSIFLCIALTWDSYIPSNYDLLNWESHVLNHENKSEMVLSIINEELKTLIESVNISSMSKDDLINFVTKIILDVFNRVYDSEEEICITSNVLEFSESKININFYIPSTNMKYNLIAQ